jgi:hypothetical protein
MKLLGGAILTIASGPNQALLERISFLETQLAAYTSSPPPKSRDGETKHTQSPASSTEERRTNSIADIVGFLSLGGEAAYVGASSGFALATNLGQMVQATVWNKGKQTEVGFRGIVCISFHIRITN